jgi:predicted chitinase
MVLDFSFFQKKIIKLTGKTWYKKVKRILILDGESNYKYVEKKSKSVLVRVRYFFIRCSIILEPPNCKNLGGIR